VERAGGEDRFAVGLWERHAQSLAAFHVVGRRMRASGWRERRRAQITPSSLSREISAASSPSSERICSVCWPRSVVAAAPGRGPRHLQRNAGRSERPRRRVVDRLHHRPRERLAKLGIGERVRDGAGAPHGPATARNREIHASAVSPASASSTRRPASSRLPTRALLVTKRGPVAHSGWAIAAAKRPNWASLATARAAVRARVG